MAATYQDVIRANGAADGWALSEAAGTDFAPWVGAVHLTGSGGLLYQQAGPFAASFGLHLAAGAKLASPAFALPLSPPVSFEMWVKLDAYPPTANTVLMYMGNASANGWGLVIKTDGTLRVLESGVAFYDTGVALGGGWHLIQLGGMDRTGSVLQVGIDGVQVWAGAVAASLLPTPNAMYFGGDSSAGATRAMTIAYPAFYNQALAGLAIRSNFMAATDPDSALALALATPGATTQSQTDLLNAILAAVRKTYT